MEGVIDWKWVKIESYGLAERNCTGQDQEPLWLAHVYLWCGH
jgi:hypothetical protein